ncbi:MAG: hypothetical protein OQK64_04160, partial [Ignavibacteriaceae bacterium]|nr:hypothetical protein [Ignavibacteriaceae bacterium]
KVRSIHQKMIKSSVEDLMRDFIAHSQVLHEPVIFVFETDLDFPYKETIFPIAEEKLLKHLSC